MKTTGFLIQDKGAVIFIILRFTCNIYMLFCFYTNVFRYYLGFRKIVYGSTD